MTGSLEMPTRVRLQQERVGLGWLSAQLRSSLR